MPRFICKVVVVRHDAPRLDRQAVALLGFVQETPRTLGLFLEPEPSPATPQRVLDVVHETFDKHPRPVPDEAVLTVRLLQFS
jgi:hypothetical protein